MGQTWKVGATLNDSSATDKNGLSYYAHETPNMKKSSCFRTETLMVAHIALGKNVNINKSHKKSVQDQHVQSHYKY